MKSSKEWYSARELEGLSGLPKQATNITRKAIKEGWEKRDAKGIKGGGFEYHYTSLPESVQAALGFNPTKVEHIMPIPPVEPFEAEDWVRISKQRLFSAIETLEQVLEITNKEMQPKAKAQMVWMIYELLNEESANEKILEIVKLVA